MIGLWMDRWARKLIGAEHRVLIVRRLVFELIDLLDTEYCGTIVFPCIRTY